MRSLLRLTIFQRCVLSSCMGAMATTSAQSIQGASVSSKHAVNGNTVVPPFPDNMKMSIFGMGCFWGAEKKFWQQTGVYSTQVGYSGGSAGNPTYREVCGGSTGHAEVVRVVYDPSVVPYTELLRLFWESHDPTQGMRQGNDVGSQYRSAIYYYEDDQRVAVETSRDAYQQALKKSGHRGDITTDIRQAGDFYYAEDYHQQYLHKNPRGYCGLGGTGVSCPRGVGKAAVKGEL